MLQLLETDALVPCPIQLRPVRKETLEFRELKRSIENLGVLNSILVRPLEGRMEVVDGNHRFAACRDLRLERIPAIVKELTDREVHLCQIQANASHVATSPVEYARRLWRLVELEKTITLPELAASLSKNLDWVKRMLGLVKLSPVCQEALESNLISLSAGIELSRLPLKDQDSLLTQFGRMPQKEFIELVRAQGRASVTDRKSARVERKLEQGIMLSPIFRPYKEVVAELEDPTMMAAVFRALDAKTDTEKWVATLKYVLCLDPYSISKRLEKSN